MTIRNLDLGTDHILGTIEGHVARLTFNRPEKRNAFDNDLLDGLAKGLDITAQDDDVRVVVLSGVGSVFCAGGDMGGMGRNGSNAPIAEKIASLTEAQERSTGALYDHPKPTIAALPGAAAGAGMSLALACDMRIAVEGACFVPAFGAIAASGDFGGSWLLPRLIGPARAKEIYFTGRRIETDEATALGLFNKVVPEQDFSGAVDTLAQGISQNAPIALRNMKQNHNNALNGDLKASMAQEAAHMMECLHTEDHKNAVAAFFEKRTPVFHGR